MLLHAERHLRFHAPVAYRRVHSLAAGNWNWKKYNKKFQQNDHELKKKLVPSSKVVDSCRKQRQSWNKHDWAYYLFPQLLLHLSSSALQCCPIVDRLGLGHWEELEYYRRVCEGSKIKCQAQEMKLLQTQEAIIQQLI